MLRFWIDDEWIAHSSIKGRSSPISQCVLVCTTVGIPSESVYIIGTFYALLLVSKMSSSMTLSTDYYTCMHNTVCHRECSDKTGQNRKPKCDFEWIMTGTQLLPPTAFVTILLLFIDYMKIFVAALLLALTIWRGSQIQDTEWLAKRKIDRLAGLEWLSRTSRTYRDSHRPRPSSIIASPWNW